MKKIKNILEAPESYFDTLPQQIQKRIQDKKTKQSIWQVAFQPKYALVLASVTILLIFSSKYLNTNPSDKQTVDFAEIPSQQISLYLLQEGVQETELVDYIQDTSPDEGSENTAIEEILEDEVDFEEIEEML